MWRSKNKEFKLNCSLKTHWGQMHRRIPSGNAVVGNGLSWSLMHRAHAMCKLQEINANRIPIFAICFFICVCMHVPFKRVPRYLKQYQLTFTPWKSYDTVRVHSSAVVYLRCVASAVLWPIYMYMCPRTVLYLNLPWRRFLSRRLLPARFRIAVTFLFAVLGRRLIFSCRLVVFALGLPRTTTDGEWEAESSSMWLGAVCLLQNPFVSSMV